MIVRLINNKEKWIPTPKVFFDILDKIKLEPTTDEDRQLITDRLEEELTTNHNAWFFNVKLSFNVKSSTGSVPCDVRILKDRTSDNVAGCIVFATESDLVLLSDFDYNYD